MASLDLGTLTIKIVGDNSDFNKKAKETESTTSKLTKNLKKDLGAGLKAGLGAAGVAMVAFAGQSIQAASDSAEAWSKFKTVFGETAASAEADLTQIANSAGRSVNELVGFASTLQDTFVPLGFSRQAAADMSTELVQLALDLASFNNLRTEDVILDLQSAMVGNTETLRKYGVIASAAAIEQEALATGLAKSKNEITAQDKALATLSLTMKGTVDAQGDAAKTADGFANQMKSLESSVLDLKIALGTGLLPVALDLVDFLKQTANDAMPAVEAATGSMGDQVESLTQKTIEQAQSFSEIQDALKKNNNAYKEASTYPGLLTGTADALGDANAELIIKLAKSANTVEDLNKALKKAGMQYWDASNQVQLYKNSTDLTLESLIQMGRVTREAAAADVILTQGITQATEVQHEFNVAALEGIEASGNYAREIDILSESETNLAYRQAEIRDETRRTAEEQRLAVVAAEEQRIAMEQAAIALSGYFTTALTTTDQTENLNRVLFDAASAAGLDAMSMATLAAATGDFTQKEIDAAFQAALMRSNIDALVAAMQEGRITADQATTALGILKEQENITAEGAIAMAQGFGQSAVNAGVLTGEVEGMKGAIDNVPESFRNMADESVSASGDVLAIGLSLDTIATAAGSVKSITEEMTTAINNIPEEVNVSFKSDLSQWRVPSEFAGAQAGGNVGGGGVPEFATGGFTGGGSGIAGLVHAGEFVFSPAAVNNIGLPALTELHNAAKSGVNMTQNSFTMSNTINPPPGTSANQIAADLDARFARQARIARASGAGNTGNQ